MEAIFFIYIGIGFLTAMCAADDEFEVVIAKAFLWPLWLVVSIFYGSLKIWDEFR